MTYTWLNLVWLFFIYSLAGWVGEVCAAVICRRKFVNRGFVNGPFCPIYGFAAVLFAIFLPDLTADPFFLFLGGTLIATVLEYFTGTFMEKVFHKKLWDYSNIRFNLGGYVCLRYSLIWGALSVVLMLFVNPFLCSVLGHLPHILSVILLWALSILLSLDFLGTALAVLGMQKQAKRFAQVTEGMQQTSTLLENALTKRMQSRMMKSYPTISLDTLIQNRKAKEKAKAKPKVFAEGCSFYKLFCLFFLGAFLGDITETIFCYITTGTLMSRSSVVYGPFSIVWGLGCSMLTALLYRYKDKSDSFLFLAGTLLGGAYEYICSVFTELVFGTVFWDYSGFTFNLGGRINLLYCFFWGIAAVVWFKLVYPYLSRLIEKVPLKYGPTICNILIVFMIYNAAISSLALDRYTERNTPADSSQTNTVQEAQDTESTAEQNSAQSADDQEASSEEAAWIQTLNAFLDKHFDDKRMARIYPNAKIVVDGVPQKIVNTN